jgi:lysyl-tRNA synthetase class 2
MEGGFQKTMRRRARIVRAIRAFFDERGFVEVTTPVMIAAPAPEPHIDCPPCGDKFLRASPELQMKKLLAAGMDKIYQIGPCFRDGERGSRHNPEFTMLEWYRRDATYLTIEEDTKALLAYLLPIAQDGRTAQSSRHRACGPQAPVITVSVREMYVKHAGWDPFSEWNQDRFDYDMATKIEPNLPSGFVFLMDYPCGAASLAKIRGDVAERWELYHNGLELANCFTELCDGEEQRLRFFAAREERRLLGESDYPIDEEFLETLPLIKSASGVALGIDRLVMALCGEDDIHSVMAGE